ncbi:MAG: hypothetical protein ACPK85_03550 [Methanosarcina sp.]
MDKLPSTFPYIFKHFVKAIGHLKDSPGMRLARWSLKAEINPNIRNKTPRKIIESWMLKSGIPETEIYSRQGHDPITSLKHYQSLSFTDYERRDIKKRLIEREFLKIGT